MRTIDPRRFGFALGATWSLLYAGCALMMAVLPRDTAVVFANMLVHGIDWEPIVKWDKSVPSMLMGVICVFVVGWLVGATFAATYNLTLPRTRPETAGRIPPP